MRAHFTAKELAGLSGMPGTESAVIRRAKRESWEFHKREGSGGGREYTVASLPLETRQALATANTKVGYEPVVAAAALHAATLRQSDEELERQRLAARSESLVMFSRLPAWRQKAANAKLAIIKSCASYIATHCLAKVAGQNSFAHEYNLDRIDVAPWVRVEIQQFHSSTLRGWITAEHELGMMGLVDCYGNRKGQSKIETWGRITVPGGETKAPMADCIRSLMLTFPHITEKKCNESLRAILADAPKVSDKSVGRYMDRWKTQNQQEFALATNPDDYKNRFQPAYGSRSEGITGPNQLWEIDATPADLLLTDGRHKIIGLCDVGPRRLKFYVNKTERARDNAFAVRRCLIDWGVPAGGTMRTDQGAPYLTDHFTRILSDLEIDHHICNPYSGDEKPHIERAFRTLSHDLIELLPGYCGHDVAQRKAIESQKSFAKRLQDPKEVIEIKMTGEELQAFCDRWCESYHNKVHSSLGKSPNRVMAEWPHPIRRISDERALDMLLCEAVRRGGKLPIIGKKGIRVNGGFYIHSALQQYTGKYCQAFQEPISLGRIIVNIRNEYDVWEFLCIAEDPKRTGISMEEVSRATRELHNEHKKEMAKHNRAARKAIKGVDVVDAVLSLREKEAAEAQGNVTHLPKRSIEHTTAGLTAAAEAAAVLDGKVAVPATPAMTPDQVAMKERLKSEMAKAQTQGVASLQVASGRQTYRKFKKLRAELAAGGTISEEDYRALIGYEQSSDYRAWKGMEEELGMAVK